MLSINNLSLRYGNRDLFYSVNLSFTGRERVGLVGRNGSGKSTILKIIAGQITPDAGSVNRSTNLTIGFLHQDLEIPEDKTIIDIVLSAKAEIKQLEHRIEELNVEIGQREDYESSEYSSILEELAHSTEHFHLMGGHSLRADGERILSGLGFKPEDME